MQIFWYALIVFFLLLLIVPIFVKGYFYFDVLGNLGAISLFVFFIKIIAYKVKIEKGRLVFFTEKNRKEVPLEISQKQLRFLEQFGVQIKQKLIVRKITIFTRIGTKDAYAAAMLNGLFNAITLGVLSYVKNMKNEVSTNFARNPNYNGNDFTVSAQINGNVTIFDVLYALIMSFIIIKRSEKYGRI